MVFPFPQAGSMMLSWCWQVVAVLVWAALMAAVAGQVLTAENPRVVQQLERNLLSAFGLRQRPRVSRDVGVPPYMMELFHRVREQEWQQEQEEEVEGQDPTPSYSVSPNTVRSFNHKGKSTYLDSDLRLHKTILIGVLRQLCRYYK